MRVKCTLIVLAVSIVATASALRVQVAKPSGVSDRGLSSAQRKELQAIYDLKKINARVDAADMFRYCKKADGLLKGLVVAAKIVLTDKEEEALADVTARYVDKVGAVTYSFIALDETKLGRKIRIIPISDYDCGK
jgi:hypothetical protein